MSNIPTVTFTGISGKDYTFEVYPKDVTFKEVSCVYIFTCENPPYTLNPLYVGQTGELKTRMSQHHKWDEVNKLDCTHICVLMTDEPNRLLIEKDLIQGLNCPCNDC